MTIIWEKRTVKQWWSSFPSISTKQTITPHLNGTHCAQNDLDIWRWNPGPGLGPAQTCDGVKINAIRITSILYNLTVAHQI
jgi:hypothetical protein